MENGKNERSVKLCPKSTIDLAGSGAKHAAPREMKHLLDKLREEKQRLSEIFGIDKGKVKSFTEEDRGENPEA